MSNKMCSVCGKNKVGIFNSFSLSDGKMCKRCLENIGLKDTNFSNDKILELLSSYEVKEMISNGKTIEYKKRLSEIKEDKKNKKSSEKEAYESLLKSFTDKKLSKYHGLYFDGDEKKILVPKTITQNYQLLKYDDLIGYTPIIREGNITKHHGLTRAAVGGAVFGVGGAIVGASTGHKNYSAISQMSIVLNFKNGYTKTITFISTDTKTNSLTFMAAEKEYNNLTSFLDRILNDSVNKIPNEKTTDANDLRNLKQLLDDGVITQEDFDAKKKQILGI